ncbi:uncharacterized oxidoreductase TM_0325-like isoform X2 [Zerene cesonia]|uniref:uncharacterized oxidoreductase TM_0325-like isoform X1 n=1 Tax=Zerene cesonia TaxID=33412 RepID=UPI0018E590AB|nr:uncharacterized oxidoreductase TM_0325-like isoform X1 [Zerene cesonia]XP_038217435.1 uncharacterized oxidoreductase TM_0325-like isoform X2 [Zerene cesonia]
MAMSFKNKVVVITGASSGIGAATGIAFAKEGAYVVLVASNKEKLRKVKKDCEAVGRRAFIIITDLSEEVYSSVINLIIKRHKRIDVLVNNAGVLDYGNIRNNTLVDAYDEIMDVNIRAPVFLTTYAAPHLIASKGNIVNVSAIDAEKVVCDEYGAFSVTKAALNQFTRAAAIELGEHGVRVNTISPSDVRTNMYKNAGKLKENVELKSVMTPWTEPEEIADLILFMASDKARGITGSNFVCDNGSMLL